MDSINDKRELIYMTKGRLKRPFFYYHEIVL